MVTRAPLRKFTVRSQEYIFALGQMGPTHKEHFLPEHIPEYLAEHKKKLQKRFAGDPRYDSGGFYTVPRISPLAPSGTLELLISKGFAQLGPMPGESIDKAALTPTCRSGVYSVCFRTGMLDPLRIQYQENPMKWLVRQYLLEATKPQTQQEIADFFKTSVSNVGKGLKSLIDEGMAEETKSLSCQRMSRKTGKVRNVIFKRYQILPGFNKALGPYQELTGKAVKEFDFDTLVKDNDIPTTGSVTISKPKEQKMPSVITKRDPAPTPLTVAPSNGDATKIPTQFTFAITPKMKEQLELVMVGSNNSFFEEMNQIITEGIQNEYIKDKKIYARIKAAGGFHTLKI